MMARRFEGGFYLVERCRRDLPPLAAYFRPDSAMRSALNELVEAAAKVDSLFRQSNEPGHSTKLSDGESPTSDA
jgi:hypothetical protein